MNKLGVKEGWGMQCPYIIIFDAECSLCNTSVNFIFKHDPKRLFYFASMHSGVARSLMLEQGLDEVNSDTIVLIKGDKAYLRAEAIYEILNELDSFWSFLGLFRFFGRACNDSFYRFIAKNRHRFLSRRSCTLPSEELHSRFLTDTV